MNILGLKRGLRGAGGAAAQTLGAAAQTLGAAAQTLGAAVLTAGLVPAGVCDAQTVAPRVIPPSAVQGTHAPAPPLQRGSLNTLPAPGLEFSLPMGLTPALNLPAPSPRGFASEDLNALASDARLKTELLAHQAGWASAGAPARSRPQGVDQPGAQPVELAAAIEGAPVRRPDAEPVSPSSERKTFIRRSSTRLAETIWRLGKRMTGLPLGESGRLDEAYDGSSDERDVRPDWWSFQLDDSSKMNNTSVKIVFVRTVRDVLRALVAARREGLKVSIAGRRYSQGGQSLPPHGAPDSGILLDMTRFNGMEIVTREGKDVLQVQSGATWAQVLSFLDDRGLSVEVMPTHSDFSVGGTIGVNAHGSNPRSGPLSSTVRAVRVLLADGRVARASREENPELFSMVLGGYGLAGVILDAEIDVRKNELYKVTGVKMPLEDFPGFYARSGGMDPGLKYVHHLVNIANFREVYAIRHDAVPAADRLPTLEERPWHLKPGPITKLLGFIFNQEKNSRLWRRVNWFLISRVMPAMAPKAITRNQVLDMPIIPMARKGETAILQEYFLPRSNIVEFARRLGELIRSHGAPVVIASIRALRGEDTPLLSYTEVPRFSIVLNFVQALTPEANARMETFTRAAIDEALRLGGAFFMPYRPVYTLRQLEAAYPQIRKFVELKFKYDPEGLFRNQWFEYVLGLLRAAPAPERGRQRGNWAPNHQGPPGGLAGARP